MTTDKYPDLVRKLKEIFQIDRPELDFGVYRVLNARRREIEEFLDTRLKARVEAALGASASAERDAVAAELRKAEENARALGADPDTLPKVRELRDRLSALASAAGDAESLVYAHLLAFFSRYYEDGDFISQRRYKDGVYAIPYSGEEVKLHWANADQYYTKTGESFTNYDFPLDGGLRVRFHLVSAETPKDNVKDNDAVRRFKLWDPADTPEYDTDDEEEAERIKALYPADFIEEKDGELIVYFQYLKFPKKQKQETLLKEAEKKILDSVLVTTNPQWMVLKHNAVKSDGKKDDKTILFKHLDRYSKKNSSDYFIHKDLGKFLRRELDFYVKNEMMHLDEVDLDATGERIVANLRTIKTFRAVAHELIDFMAQLEDFQKKLWLKRKFVVQCDWCITMDLVPEDLRTEVLANSDQIAEWKRLGVDADPKADNLTANDARMVDTKFFDESFKSKLLASIPDLDARTDGVLVHSENFQALRLLQERYKEQVKCIYIDPPYNTGDGDFPYKDDFRHSSWASMMEDRLYLSKVLLPPEGMLGCHMDEHEHELLDWILGRVYGDGNLGPLVWDKRNPKGDVAGIAAQHEYVHFAAKDKDVFSKTDDAFIRDKPNAPAMLKKAEQLIRKARGVTDKVREEFAEWVKKSDFSNGEKAYQFIDDNGDVYQSVSMAWPNKKKAPDEYFKPLIHPVTKKPCPIPARGWRNPPITMKSLLDKGLILFGPDEKTQPRRKYLLKENMTEMVPSLYYMGGSDDAIFKDMNIHFENPKPVQASLYFLKTMARPADSVVVDYFAGSGTTGHAVINLNREDRERGINANRKYILVEMGEHFETVLKPRLEKVVYSPDWKDGKPETADKGISHCFKYLTLESYEDTLNNLELKKPDGAASELLGSDEYLLRYMLDVEARGSLLSTDDFRHPFDYEMKIAADSSGAYARRKIDLVETFNWLVGLRVESEERLIDSRSCVLVEGTLPNGERALVAWRDVDKVDTAALAALLKSQGYLTDGKEKPAKEVNVLYVNGDHSLRPVISAETGETKVRSIEEEFLSRMFGEAR